MSEIILPPGLPKDLQVHTIPANTMPWYDFRSRGIGGSDVGYLMGLSQYKASIEVFYEKIGDTEPFMEDNEATFHGKYFEGYLKKMWEYWDGKDRGYIKNYQAGVKIREVKLIDSYIVNPKYPWLFASLDGLIPQGQFSLLKGAPKLEKPGILEVKTISGFYMKQWEAGIPPQYLAQVHQYMLVLDLDYCEIILMKDGRYLSVLPIERNQKMCDRILEMTHDFWYERVEPAKALKKAKIMYEKDDRFDLAEQAIAQVHELEPPPDESPAYKEFLAKKLLFDPISKEGEQQQLFDAINYKKWSEAVKACENVKRGYENKIRHHMNEINADKLDFLESGYIALTQRKGSNKTTFNNRVKVDIDADDIRDEIDTLNI